MRNRVSTLSVLGCLVLACTEPLPLDPEVVPQTPRCGNGLPEGDEECDDEQYNSDCGSCSVDCRINHRE